MARVPRKTESAVFGHMLSKYQTDPEWVNRHLPEIGEIMSRTVSPIRTPQSPFGLTERERAFHIESLPRVEGLDELQPEDAVKALERCAALIRDNSLPFEFNHQALVRLFKAAFDKTPGSFKTNTVIPISQKDGGDDAVHHASLVRGVVLNLDLNMKLLSVTITPRKVRERKRLMSIVGIGRYAMQDGADGHDDHITEQTPHASS